MHAGDVLTCRGKHGGNHIGDIAVKPHGANANAGEHNVLKAILKSVGVDFEGFGEGGVVNKALSAHFGAAAIQHSGRVLAANCELVASWVGLHG